MTAAERAEIVLEPRDAATVMLVRDEPDLHVFMLRRNLDSVWIAGASVFPGGAVDDADRSERWGARCAGWDDVRASRAIGVDHGGLGFFVAAVRETFEEAGVLLARDGAGRPVDGRGPGLVAAREGLNAGRLEFGAFVADQDLRLATDELHLVSHWVTPPGGPRRYNTWFLAAAAPPGSYVHDDTELIASAWVRPRAALAAAARGDIDLILPTRKNLELLAHFDRADDFLAAADAAAPKGGAARLRLMVESSGGRRIALPGEAGDDGTVP